MAIVAKEITKCKPEIVPDLYTVLGFSDEEEFNYFQGDLESKILLILVTWKKYQPPESMVKRDLAIKLLKLGQKIGHDFGNLVEELDPYGKTN